MALGKLEGEPSVLGTLLQELGTVSLPDPYGQLEGKRRSSGVSATLLKGDFVPAPVLSVERRPVSFS